MVDHEWTGAFHHLIVMRSGQHDLTSNVVTDPALTTVWWPLNGRSCILTSSVLAAE